MFRRSGSSVPNVLFSERDEVLGLLSGGEAMQLIRCSKGVPSACEPIARPCFHSTLRCTFASATHGERIDTIVFTEARASLGSQPPPDEGHVGHVAWV